MSRRCSVVAILSSVLFWIAGLHAAEKLKVPKDFQIEQVAIAPEEDAYTDWKIADEAFVPLPSSELSLPLFKSWSIKGEKVPEDQMSAIKNWIGTNKVALEAIERSLRKSKARLPQFKPTDIAPVATASAYLAKARLFMADEAASRGDHTTATNIIFGNLKFTRLLRDADAPALHYSIARISRTFADEALVRWAWFSNAKAPMIRDALEQLPPLDDEMAAYERMLRVELAFGTGEADLGKLQKQWIDATKTNALALYLMPEELQRALFIVHDPQLLAMHPKPLDREQELDATAARFRKMMLYARSKWSAANTKTLMDETERLRTAYVDELKPVLEATADEGVPLSKSVAERAAKYYVKIKNPVGRFWGACDGMGMLTRTFVNVFQSRTERNAMRTLLALRIFELEHDTLPKSLSDLVDSHLLPSLPMDYFSNAPLHYSPEKRLLWSVAENGVDDGGVSGKPNWQNEDRVWQIPPTTAGR